MMARVGIYGGAFNPIHNGHLHIVRDFIRVLGLDFVLLIPTGISPHKAAAALSASAEDRLAMCRLACEGLGKIRVSDCEIRRAGKSYTADTITELKKQYPDDELFLLMGEDMFLTVQNWFDAPRIFRGATLCAAPRSPDGAARLREHARKLQQDFPYVHTFVEQISFLDVSSTDVREALARGESIDRMVPPAVADYIIRHGLYGTKEEDR